MDAPQEFQGSRRRIPKKHVPVIERVLAPKHQVLVIHSHDNENRTDYHALDASPEDGVRDDRQCFIDDHIGEKQSNKQEVPVLPDRLNLVRILSLVAISNCIRGVICSAHIKYPRRSANTKYIELRFIQAHITQCQTGKQTRQQDKNRNEDWEDNVAYVSGSTTTSDKNIAGWLAESPRVGRKQARHIVGNDVD
jgi:hypothetical protein